MLAMLFAQKILLGEISFSEVPPKLKDKVKKCLEESGYPELAQ